MAHWLPQFKFDCIKTRFKQDHLTMNGNSVCLSQAEDGKIVYALGWNVLNTRVHSTKIAHEIAFGVFIVSALKEYIVDKVSD